MSTGSRMRLAEARVRYIDRLADQGLAPITVRTKSRTIGRLIRDLGDLQMANVSNQHVEDWIYGLRREHVTEQHGRQVNPGISASTFNQTLSNLRGFFRWAQGSGYIRHDPTINLKTIPVPKRTRLRPDPAVLLDILEAATFPRDRAYIAIAINTALRDNEIRRIRVRDLDLDSGYMSVVIPKTGDVDDRPVTADLDKEMRRWLTYYQAEIGRAFEEDDYLIPATTAPLIESRFRGQIQHGPRVLRPKDKAGRLSKYIHDAMRAVGLPTYYEGTHTFRRAVARAFFDQASEELGDVAALRETSSLLNHKNISTTEGYLGMSPEKNRRDRRLRGQPFLTALRDRENVVPLGSAHGLGELGDASVESRVVPGGGERRGSANG